MNKDIKQILKNFTGLSSVQAFSLILPFIYIPYATRVIGVENFGIVEYCVNYVVYFTCFINYGFYYSATKRVSINRDNITELNKIFSEVVFTKLLLFIVISLVYFIILFKVDFFYNEKLAFTFAYIALINAVIIPWFFFQGKEDFKTIALIMFFVKVLSVVYVFLFIKDKDDYPFLVAVNTIPESILGISSFLLIKKKYNVSLQIKVKLQDLIRVLKNNFYVFANDFSILLYINSIVFFAGLSLNKTDLGNYTSAYKIVLIIQTLILSTFTKTVFPYLSKLFSEDKKLFIKRHKQISKYYAVTLLLISCFLLLFAEIIIKIIFGNDYLGAVSILKTFSFLPLFIGMGGYYGWIGMVVINQQKKLFKIVLTYGTLVIITLLLLSKEMSITTFSHFRLLIEIAVFITIFLFFNKNVNKIIEKG